MRGGRKRCSMLCKHSWLSIFKRTVLSMRYARFVCSGAGLIYYAHCVRSVGRFLHAFRECFCVCLCESVQKIRASRGCWSVIPVEFHTFFVSHKYVLQFAHAHMRAHALTELTLFNADVRRRSWPERTLYTFDSACLFPFRLSVAYL